MLSFCNHLAVEETARCSNFIVFWCHITISALCIFLTVLWVDLNCAIVAFVDHIHLLFDACFFFLKVSEYI